MAVSARSIAAEQVPGVDLLGDVGELFRHAVAEDDIGERLLFLFVRLTLF